MIIKNKKLSNFIHKEIYQFNQDLPKKRLVIRISFDKKIIL